MPRSSMPFTPLAWKATPVEVAARMRSRPGFVFLDSALESNDSISILASDPSEIIDGGPGDWGQLGRLLEEYRVETPDQGLPAGAAIGWFGFDGRFRFGFYPDLLLYRHRTESWLACGSPHLSGEPPLASAAPLAPAFHPTLSGPQFCAMVRRAQEYIAAGDIYQVCLSHRFDADRPFDPWAFYQSLRHYSPAPCAGYLSLGPTTVLSSSPETFLRLSGTRIGTRPIKGTRPRVADPLDDERSAFELLTSSKEIAELIMITDLERSDLGRVCEFGTVRVPELLHLERYEQVFHLVSTVEGTLRPGVSHLEALRACFPGGSISGAPKKRALEIIAELEPVPRGLYTGSIGWFGFNGESRFNIAIRTVVIDDGRASFHAGAGIVADSIPENEWLETLHKASGILLAAQRMAATASPADPGDIPLELR